MGANSKIEWTDASWTPIRARNLATRKVGWHCEHATAGCLFCYAETLNKRLGTGLPFKPGHRKEIELFLDEKMLTAPLRWKRPRMIFVCSMTDLFADFVPDAWIDRLFAVMALSPQHTFQVLTKRSFRMRTYTSQAQERVEDHAFDWLDSHCGRDDAERWNRDAPVWPLPNVWLGVSAERQQEADERIPDLLATPAAVRFVSAEPLLGPIDLMEVIPNPLIYNAVHGMDPLLDWVIAGGESGPQARPMHPDWARSLRDQCAAAGVPFFFKQWGEWLDADQMLDRIERGPAVIERGSQRWRPRRPLNFEDAAFLANLCSFPYEHRSDGSTMLRLGKSRSGRALDGIEHDGMPR